MPQKSCPSKRAKSGNRVPPVKAPVSSKVHHTKSSAKVAEPWVVESIEGVVIIVDVVKLLCHFKRT